MKKIKRTNRKKKLITLLVVLLLLLAGAAAFAYYNNLGPFADKDTPESTNGPTKEQKKKQKKLQSEQKKQYIEATTGENTPTPAPVPADNSGISISHEVAVNEVIVSTELKGFSNGSCLLNISNGSKRYSSEAEILYQDNFSTCAGFSIPKAELGNGTWKVSLKVTPTGGETLTKEHTVEVK